MRIEEQIDVEAPVEEVWKRIADPVRYPEFLRGVTRWQRAGGKRTGTGARYSVRMHVGNAHVGGIVEIVEFTRHHELAWVSITGIDQRGRWRLREKTDGTSQVTLRLIYDSPGGWLGQLAEFLSVPMVRSNLRASLQELKRRIETEGDVGRPDQAGARSRGRRGA